MTICTLATTADCEAVFPITAGLTEGRPGTTREVTEADDDVGEALTFDFDSAIDGDDLAVGRLLVEVVLPAIVEDTLPALAPAGERFSVVDLAAGLVWRAGVKMPVRDVLELEALVAAALDKEEMPEAEEAPDRRLPADGPFRSGEIRFLIGEEFFGGGRFAEVTVIDAVLSSDDDLRLFKPVFALTVELSGRAFANASVV